MQQEREIKRVMFAKGQNSGISAPFVFMRNKDISEFMGAKNMKYAIELYYDKETEKRLFDLAKKIADKKISTKFLEWKTRPHITLACFNDIDEASCIDKLKDFAQNHKAMSAYLSSVGMFNDTKVVFINPTMNRSMYEMQRELHEYLRDFDTKGWEWYLPDRWVPHCAIALTGNDTNDAFYKASDLILREFEKICGKFVSVGLVKITFPVEEIFTADLAV